MAKILYVLNLTCLLVAILYMAVATYFIHTINVFSYLQHILIIVFLASLFFYFVKKKNKPSKAKVASKNKHIFSVLYFSIIIAFTAYISLFSYQEFLGGRDPGVYIDTAYVIAETGSAKKFSEALKNTYDSEGFAAVKKLFHYESRPDRVGHNGYYFVGNYLENTEEGLLVSQFFRPSSVFAAIFISLFGLSSVQYLLPTVYFLIFTLLFFISKKVLKLSSFASVSLLLMLLSSPAVLFWARSFNSESFVMMLVLLMIANMYLFFKSKRIGYALFASLSFVLAFTTRGEPIFLLPVLAVFIAHIEESWKRQITAVFSSVAMGISVWTIYLDTYPYASYQFGRVFKYIGITQQVIFDFADFAPFIMAVFTYLLVVFAVLVKKIWDYIDAHKLSKKIYNFLSTNRHLIAGVAVMTSLLIMQVTFFDNYFSNRPNLIKLSWYIGGIVGVGGFVYSAAHYVLLSWRKVTPTQRVLYVFTILLLLFSVWMLNDAQISKDHPWWSRRFLYNAILIAPLLVAQFVDTLKSSQRILGAFLVLVLVASNLYYAQPVLSVKKYDGSLNYLQELNTCFATSENPSIVFDTSYGRNNFEYRLEYLAGYFFGQPLWTYFDREVYYPRESTTPAYIADFFADKVANNELFVVNPSENYELFVADSQYELSLVCESEFAVEMLGWRSIPKPLEMTEDVKLNALTEQRFSLPISVYRLILSDEIPPSN